MKSFDLFYFNKYLLYEIFKFLTLKDLARLSLTCKSASNLLNINFEEIFGIKKDEFFKEIKKINSPDIKKNISVLAPPFFSSKKIEFKNKLKMMIYRDLERRDHNENIFTIFLNLAPNIPNNYKKGKQTAFHTDFLKKYESIGLYIPYGAYARLRKEFIKHAFENNGALFKSFLFGAIVSEALESGLIKIGHLTKLKTPNQFINFKHLMTANGLFALYSKLLTVEEACEYKPAELKQFLIDIGMSSEREEKHRKDIHHWQSEIQNNYQEFSQKTQSVISKLSFEDDYFVYPSSESSDSESDNETNNPSKKQKR